MIATTVRTKQQCYHCGDDCPEHPIWLKDKPFCCEGCQAVYQLLQDNELCTYYDLEKNPGFKIKASPQERFAYLDNEQIVDKLLDYKEGKTAKVRLYIPKIHCSSCIWLLENLYKLEKGILSSRVHFLKKEIDFVFQRDTVSLRHIVEVLDALGYTPELHLDSYNKAAAKKEDKSLYFKIGISGFCASNIMMLSFPEYLGMDGLIESRLSYLFTYLNLLFSLPVVFYAASDYYVSAWKGLKNRMLNLDVPIALGTTAVFLRSVYEVITHIGPGYFDSLTGLVFFLLIGKWIQSRTYKHFSFERDYQSYLPIAVTKIEEGQERPLPIQDLQVGDSILVRQNEVIPADSILEEGEDTSIDYSFVTGESQPVPKRGGELLYAGGKVLGRAVYLRVKREVSNSYLLQLWNQQVFKKPTNAYLSSFVLSFSSYFVIGTLLITLLTGVYWSLVDPSKLLFSTASVLLVACPCALALSLPFAFGNCLRLLSEQGLFLKNADTVEKLAEIDTLVFDKTGTLTKAGGIQVEFVGSYTDQELSFIRTAAGQSVHPLSKAVYASLETPLLPVTSFVETQGKGIAVEIDKVHVRMGSSSFLGLNTEDVPESRLYVEIQGKLKGYFIVTHLYRSGWEALLRTLKASYQLHLLSGDNEGQKQQFTGLIQEGNMRFSQLPLDKLEYIQKLQKEGRNVLMVGDGLNDAGALKAADVGISVAEDVYHFIPACDGICEANSLTTLSGFLRYAKMGVRIVKMSLVLSLLYNAVGLYYAVQGILSPLIAAILMPLSSVSVVLFAVVCTTLASKTIK